MPSFDLYYVIFNIYIRENYYIFSDNMPEIVLYTSPPHLTKSIHHGLFLTSDSLVRHFFSVLGLSFPIRFLVTWTFPPEVFLPLYFPLNIPPPFRTFPV